MAKKNKTNTKKVNKEKSIIVKKRLVSLIKTKEDIKISKEYLKEFEIYLNKKIEEIIKISLENSKLEKRKTLLKRDMLEAEKQRTLI